MRCYVVVEFLSCGVVVFSRGFSGVWPWRLFSRSSDSAEVSVFVSLGCSELMMAVSESFDVHVSASDGHLEHML